MVTNSVVPIANPPSARATTAATTPAGATAVGRSVVDGGALTLDSEERPRRPAFPTRRVSGGVRRAAVAAGARRRRRGAASWAAATRGRPARRRRRPGPPGAGRSAAGARDGGCAARPGGATRPAARGPRRHPARGSRAARRRGSAPAPSRPRPGPSSRRTWSRSVSMRPRRRYGRDPTRSGPTSRRSRESSARTVTATASPAWHSAASCAALRPSPATAASASSSSSSEWRRESSSGPDGRSSRARSRPSTSSRAAGRGAGGAGRRPAPFWTCCTCNQRSSDSTAATVARTSVSTCGLATWSPPVTSMAPSRAPVNGIVHRGGRAAPRLDGTAEVLAAADLDGVVDGERGAGGVGTGDVLGPARALDEVHAGGLAAQPGVALHPQHPAAGVGDGDDHLVGLGVLHQQAADHRHDRRQRVGGTVGEQLVVEQLDRRRQPVGVDPAAEGAAPGVADDRPDDRVGGQPAGR